MAVWTKWVIIAAFVALVVLLIWAALGMNEAETTLPMTPETEMTPLPESE